MSDIKVEEEYIDVLQNIEFGIVQVSRAEASLIDADVLDAVDALIRHYVAEENGRHPPEYRLAEKPVRVFASVKDVCELRLGRRKLAGEDDEPTDALTVSEVVLCLRRIRQSIRMLTKHGRKGYLEFVSQYVL